MTTIFEKHGIDLHDILNPRTCTKCDGAGIYSIYDDYTKPYEVCEECEGHGVFTNKGRIFSVIPAFDRIQKIESKEGTRYAFIFKGKVVKYISQEEYEKEVQG